MFKIVNNRTCHAESASLHNIHLHVGSEKCDFYLHGTLNALILCTTFELKTDARIFRASMLCVLRAG